MFCGHGSENRAVSEKGPSTGFNSESNSPVAGSRMDVKGGNQERGYCRIRMEEGEVYNQRSHNGNEG